MQINSLLVLHCGFQWESLSTKFVKQNDSLSALQLQFHDLDTQVDNYVLLTLFTNLFSHSSY